MSWFVERAEAKDNESLKGVGMSLLSTATTGKSIGAQIHVIAGNNGVGKTTWASAFPDVVMADLESGARHIAGVARVSKETLKDLTTFRSFIKELTETTHNYKNFAIDSVESLEGMISDFVCAEGKVTSLEDYGGGYGKGHSRTREIMREIMMDLQNLRDKKSITTILVAHTQVKTMSDPATNLSYDRVIMRCNDKMAAIIRDLSDNVFYATYKVFMNKENGKMKAYGDGQRVMYTQWRPGFDAKNRLELPLELPLSYDAFIEELKKDKTIDMKQVIADINEISKAVDDTMKKVVAEQVEKFKTNPAKLNEVKNRLMSYVEKIKTA